MISATTLFQGPNARCLKPMRWIETLLYHIKTQKYVLLYYKVPLSHTRLAGLSSKTSTCIFARESNVLNGKQTCNQSSPHEKIDVYNNFQIAKFRNENVLAVNSALPVIVVRCDGVWSGEQEWCEMSFILCKKCRQNLRSKTNDDSAVNKTSNKRPNEKKIAATVHGMK